MKFPVIQNNIDVYRLDDEGNEHLLLKFRKKVLTDNEIKLGWNFIKIWRNQVVVENKMLVRLIQIIHIGKKEISKNK